MKLDAAAYHSIVNLTLNVAVSPAEADVWKKCLLETADEKIKMQKCQLTLNLLRKLHKRGLGLNSVEFYAKKSSGEGPRRKLRRKRTVQLLMKGKLEDAVIMLERSKENLNRKLTRVERRWGHHRATMIAFREILSNIAVKVWEDGRDKNKRKIEHLEKKWRNNQGTEAVEGVWRGVKIGDKELEEEMTNEEVEAPKAPHKYGGVTSNADEDALLALPHKFTTYESIQLDKIKVSTEIMKDKIRWELRTREEEREGAPWTEDWEFEQQEEKEVFRPEERRMEFSRRRVTDMPTNRFVHIPNPAGPEVETVLDNMSNRVYTVAKAYILEKCDKKGNILEKNLSQQEQRGLKSLAKRVNEKELIVQKTDKGGDLALNTPDNYIETMKPHFQSDPDFSWEDHEKLEAELNACSIQFARVLRVGAKWGHWTRVKSAVTSHNGPIPLLSGYPKTHKDISNLSLEEQLKGPPVRPVCGASDSNNGPLSDLLSQICMQLGDEMDESIGSLCISQEEMCGEIEKVNNRGDIKKLVVFSMDVSKMFPSMVASDVAKVVREEYMMAKLEVEVDDKELGLMLAILVGQDEVERLGLGEVVCKRKRRGGRPILITTKWITGERGGQTENLFHDPERNPTAAERRQMFALLLELMVIKVMGNHVYCFNGTNKLQLEGGPIGLKLSGAVAKVVMLSWSRRFRAATTTSLSSFANFDLYMLQFYVDDTMVATEELEPGCRFVKEEGKVRVVEEEVEGDKLVASDVRTARVLNDIGNTIFSFLQFTIDCPSEHNSGWMPLLATEVKVAEDNTIDYRFYEKPISSKYVMMRNSAMSARVKMNTLTQEVIRRLRNTRTTLPWADFQAPILTKFSKKMKRSGYSENYRNEVIRSGILGFERQLEASRSGVKPLFRPREWQKAERRKRKMVRKAAWYRPADCVGFYPPTPRGELANEIGKVLKEEGERINMRLRAIETGGLSIGKQLVRPDLKAGEPCGRPGCVLDKCSGGAGGPHNVPSVVYRGVCKLCGVTEVSSEYWGESAFSGSYRSGIHESDVESRKETNAFYKHLEIFHPESQRDIVHFDIQVQSVHKKSLTRQKTEAVKIQSSTANNLLNSKAEHRQPALLRVRMVRENENDDVGADQRGRRRRGQ